MAKQSLTLTFQDPRGQPLAGGSVTLRLNTDAVASGGTQISAGRLVTAILDGSGSATILIWPNDQLTPSGTVYFIVAYTALGQPAWRGQLVVTTTIIPDYIVQGDGGRIELGSGTGFLLWG